MKKQLLWVLTLALIALFPYQNATASLVQLDRNGWSVYNVSSQYAGLDGDYYVDGAKALDGNLSTYWHSDWAAISNQTVPQWIVFDLGEEKTFEAFNYVSRKPTARSANGQINEYKIYVSTTAPTVGSLTSTMAEIKSGTFTYDGSSVDHIVDLGQKVSARYVMLYAVTTYGEEGDDKYANCAEFYLYKKDYCTPSGNMASASNKTRKLNSFVLSDGPNSVSVSNIQTSYTDAVYKDKTTSVLSTTQGATLSFSALDWNGDWMHAYVYIDYNRDKEFNTTANNNGATNGELVSYNYYNGKNINNVTMDNDCGVSYNNIPSWTLPSDLEPGEYRLRFKIDWDNLDACGSGSIAGDNGCVVDITLNVVSSAPTNSRPQDLFTSANISQANQIYPYRIPGITSTNKEGRLIATAARLVCGTDPGYGRVDAVCRISDDNGVTWGDEKTIAAGNGQTSATTNYFETAYGDPAVIADRTSDEVIVVVVAGCTLYTSDKTTRNNPNMIGIIRSTDNGDTWGAPENITEDIYKLYDNVNTVNAAFVAGGKIFQSRIVKVGKYYRLYAAMCARPNGNRVIYSDDFGRTWKPLGGAAASITPDNGNEPKCEELPDGRVILSSRNASGNGRLYNIYTYTNTTTGEGSWGSCTASSFSGSNQAPGSNNTNGEILIVPVKRNSDNKEMYLVLQSQPTGNDRVNVGIYYKELTNLDDMNTVANFATGWNGFYQVSTTYSAYSSMDLQDDGKVGFFYEETLTRDGQVQNPVSTSFTDGSGVHNFDGYNNIYRAYTIEQLTNNAYSLKEDINRGTFVKTYLTAAVDASALPTATKDNLKAEINQMGAEPTTTEVDAIYTELNKDPWDGKVVTFTNIQSNGDQRALYITGSVLSLGTTSQTAESIGASAQFLCKKEASGKYSFKNIATNEYMIWRAGTSQIYGYNDNKGTLSSYEATYCDWLINDANSTKADTYYMVGKRSDGTDDGSLIVAQSNGAFDSWGTTPICGTHTDGNNYSNVYYINIVSSNVEQALATAEDIISKTGVGYPKQGSAARTTLQTAIDAAKADASVVNGLTLQNAINNYYTTTDIELPTDGVLYSFIVGHTTNKAYIYNNDGTLAVAKYTEGETVLPETAKFTCVKDGEYFVFRTSDGKYIAYPGYNANEYTGSSPDGIEDNITDLTRFSTPKILNGGNVAASSNAELFGNVYLNAKLRGTIKTGNNAGNTINGVYVVKFKNNGTLLDSPQWDGSSVPYANDNYSSAISVVALGYSLTATAEPATGASQLPTVTPNVVEKGGSATFTAYDANSGYIFDGWYNGSTRLTSELVYEATDITATLNLVAKYIQQAKVSVTVPSEFGKVMKGEEVVNGSVSGNKGETVTLTAVPDEGYIFNRWVRKAVSSPEVVLSESETINVVLGSYSVEAYFVPEAYSQICKPSFAKAGNTTVVTSATITEGIGVENTGVITGLESNINTYGNINTAASASQWGVTEAIKVEPGATFALNIEYVRNWEDLAIYQINGSTSEWTKLYGPYEGSWSETGNHPNPFDAMVADGITLNGNTATYSITIPQDVNNGDVIVIRSLTGGNQTSACQTGIAEGGYIDFVFVVEVKYTLTATVNAEQTTWGSASVTPAEVKHGGSATFTATPAEGYEFKNWTVDGEEVSTDAEYTIGQITENLAYVANFVKKTYSVTVTAGEGGTVKIDEGEAQSTITETVAHGETVTLIATPNTGYDFLGWYDGETKVDENLEYTVTVTADLTLTAKFAKQTFTVSATPDGTNGTAIVSPSGTVEYGTEVTFTATPITGYRFVSWSNGETANPYTTAITANTELIANFELIPTYTVTVTAGEGGIVNTIENPVTHGETVTLTATPAEGYKFKNWTVDGEEVSTDAEYTTGQITENVEYVANFVKKTYTVTVTAGEGGTVNTIDNPVTHGETVTLTATPAEGYKFSSWSDNSTKNPYTIAVTDNVSLTANFERLATGERTITVQSNDLSKGTVSIDLASGSGMGTGTGAGGQRPSITTSEDVIVTASVQGNDNYEFVNWTIDGVVVSTEKEYRYTRRKGAVIQANFNLGEGVFPTGYPMVERITTGGTPFVEVAAKEVYSHALQSFTATFEGSETSFVISNQTINHGYINSCTIYVKQGGQLTIDFTVGDWPNNIWFGFDWNRDGKFEDVIKGYPEGKVGQVNNSSSITIDIPEDALPGKSVMRIISDGIVDQTSWDNHFATYPDVAPMNGTHGLVNTDKGLVGVIGYAGSLYDVTLFVNKVIKSTVKLTKEQIQNATVNVTTNAPAEIKVGSTTYNTTEDNLTVQIPVSEESGENITITAYGANIDGVDCGNTLPTEDILPVTELTLRNVNASEVAIEAPLLKKITVVSDAENNATTVSPASDLSQGVQVVVEKEIKTPQPVEGNGTPTIFNFLSMPFSFNTADIKYWDGDSWETAEPENHVRILLYDSQIRANHDYDNTWRTLQATESETIAANQGFVIVGNNDLGTTVKLQFTSAVAAYDGTVTSVTANRYRKEEGETNSKDGDWNFNGVPYLTAGEFVGDYTLYTYDNSTLSYVSHTPAEGLTLKPYQAVMYQAEIEGANLTKDIAINTASISNANATDDVYARAYISIDDATPAKIILCDETSENFVVNEDAWYMPSLINTTPAAYFNIEGADASVSVQPSANELPMTVYTGAGTSHRISLAATDGNYNVYLKDVATNETVCLNDEDYTFTATAKTTIANRFTISMLEPTGITESAADATLKAVVLDNTIKIYGTEQGEEIALYTANGMIITNAVAEEGVTTIDTTATGVIIIKVAEETLKVVK